MKNRTQSFTSISFDTSSAPGPSAHLRHRGVSRRQESTVDSILPEEQAGKDLLELCQEIAGVLIRRYLVSDSAADVRAETAKGLKERLSCSGRQAQALITLALEIIHVKSYGKYRISPERLEKLIATVGGVAK
ncbi:hypothetical protein N9B73_10050 [Verrucomicrobiales bacterium]|jgi:hypothetical protein|nr:hypothetical protein [Verrucomicrobiales bacterium]|tara:strand:+ start:1421 stop:1819 length:399 start_codon:yes stop_codon:yes gene_type:complete